MSHQHHDLFLGVAELQPLEDHEVDDGEALPEPAANGLGMVHGKKFGRQHHGQAPGWFEERGRVHKAGCPR